MKRGDAMNSIDKSMLLDEPFALHKVDKKRATAGEAQPYDRVLVVSE